LPQIIRITSEALQASIRRLLPSQQGFGLDLEATNVVTPIIDLTPTAEGSVLGVNLQTAIAFGSQTAFSAANSTAVIANTAGFYRIFMNGSVESRGGGNNTLTLQMSDGISTKNIWGMTVRTSTTRVQTNEDVDIVVFLDSGESISVISNDNGAIATGSVRQLADINGNLVNPRGFTSE